jgi:hypothetical protein
VTVNSFTQGELLAWQRETCYASPNDWVFASAKAQGRMPPWSDTLLDRILLAAKRKLASPSGSVFIPTGIPTRRCSRPTEKMSK